MDESSEAVVTEAPTEKVYVPNDNDTINTFDNIATNSGETVSNAAVVNACPGASISSSSSVAAFPIPMLHSKQLNRQFDLEARINSEVTALDISAHGAHVLVGFGNGFIICE
jgi:hypothetical protein